VLITWNDLTVNFKHIERTALVDDWQLLVGTSALPILISSVGDMFLQESSGEVYWLITGSGEYEKVANSYEEFQSKLQNDEIVNEWFLVPVVVQLKEKGVNLEAGKLYGFKQLPVLGGAYETNSFELKDIEIHLAMSGQINLQIRDLSDGTNVNFKITE